MAPRGSLTYEQIMRYLMSGGDIDTLVSEGNVSQKQLLEVMVRNPEIFSSVRSESRRQVAGLDKFRPNSWYSAETSPYQPEVNEVDYEWAQMEEPARALAGDYFARVAEAGNNPIRVAEIEKYFSDPTVIEGYGIDPSAKFLILDKLKKDAPRWYSRQLEVERKNEEIQRRNMETNYKAFQEQRKQLGVRSGESALAAALRTRIGLPELADVPDPSRTFADVASTMAGEKYKSKELEKNKARVTSASLADWYQRGGVKADKKLQQSLAETEKQRKGFERGFVRAAEKKLGKGATPYTEAIKKLLPRIAARLTVEG